MSSFTSRHKGKIFSIGLIIAVLTFLPNAVQYVIKSSLQKQGFDDVTIDNVDINLFTGSAEIDNLNIVSQQQRKLKLGKLAFNYNWRGIFSGGVTIQSITISDTYLKIQMDKQGELEIVVPITKGDEAEKVTALDKNTEDNSDKGVALPKLNAETIVFSNVNVDIDIPQYLGNLQIKNLQLNQATTWQDQQTTLLVDALLNNAEIKVNLNADLFEKQPSVKGTIKVKQLELTDFQGFLDNDVQLNRGLFAADISFSGKQNETGYINADIDAELRLNDLRVGYQSLFTSVEDWQLDLSIQQQMFSDKNTFTVNLSSLMNSVLAQDREQEYVVLKANQLNIKNIQANEQLKANVEQIALTDFSFNHTVDQPEGTLMFDSLNMAQIEFINAHNDEPSKVYINDITVKQLTDIIHLSEEYQLLGFEQLTKMIDELTQQNEALASNEEAKTSEQSEGIAATKPEIEPGKPIKISIARFTVEQGSEIVLEKDFSDTTIRRHYDIEEITLSNLVVNDPNNTSEFVFKVKPDEFSLIDIEGDGKLFSQPLELNAQGHLDAMSLVKLSPFAEPVIGYQLQNGQLDHQFTLALKENTMDMKNHLVVRKLEFKEIEAHQQNAENASGLPLGMAIRLLEDSNGKIEIDVPIKSDLNNTDIGLGDAVRTSLATVVQKSSLSLLKYSLQPFGAIIMATELVVDQVNNVSFQPLLFTVNSAIPITEQAEYPQKLASLLLQKENLAVNLCGYSNAQDKALLETVKLNPPTSQPLESLPVETEVTPSDQPTELQPEVELTVEAQLTNLAQARSNYLKAFLVDQGIESKRLYLCKPQYKDDAIMGVEIGM